MPGRTFAEILKDQPDVADVHIRGGQARRRRRAAYRPARTQPVPLADQHVNEDDPAAAAQKTLGIFKAVEVKADEHLIFGWASVVTKGGKLIVDKQGDVIEPAELENAAYEFVLNARDHGHMHRTIGTGRMVESMVFTDEKQKALGIDLGQEGWFVGFKVDEPAVWDAHKRGELPEFSIGGLAVPVDHLE
jgi:hypothetical protein